MSEEKLPTNETIKVIEYTTIYKNNKWWCAVVLANMFGHNKIMVYLWQNRNGQWRRKHKFGINFEKDWVSIRTAIEKYMPRLGAIN